MFIRVWSEKNMKWSLVGVELRTDLVVSIKREILNSFHRAPLHHIPPAPPPTHTQTHFLPQIAAFLSVFLHFFSFVFCMLMLTFCVCDLDLKQKLHTNANNLKSESDGCFSHENYQDIFVNKFQFQRAN
jgi:hypothetical protein